MKTIGTIALFLSILVSLQARDITIDLYGADIQLEYEPALVATYRGSLSREADMVKLYQQLEKRPYQSLLLSLKKAKAKYQLNDWHYYQLMEKTVQQISKSSSERFNGVLSWMLLAKSGYDARATYTKRRFYVNVSSQETLYDSPLFEFGGELFINLSMIYNKNSSMGSVYAMEFVPNNNGRDFNFSLRKLPRLPSKKQQHTYSFSHQGKTYRIQALVDKTLIDMMNDYPKFGEIHFIETPFSATARRSLLPALKKEMMGMSDKEQMEFLVAFTRRGLQYGSDEKNFGTHNRPLTADEALHYPYVDCEDKVAVLYNLVKELTDLPAIVLAIPDHLSFAVQLKQPVGKTFRHQGRTYTICDPAGPENNSEIGVFPFKGLQRGKVLGGF